jgi:ABC-type transport system substrate-binding protein
MYRTIVTLTVLLAMLAGTLGCDGRGYNEANKQAASAITPRSEWTITASPDVVDPARAIDGNVGSSAQTGSDQSGAWVAVDLGDVCYFNTVIVDHGTSEESYAGRVTILTSVDGVNYTYRFTGPGNRRISIFSLVTPALARYVRLEVSKPGPRLWSLSEIYLR